MTSSASDKWGFKEVGLDVEIFEPVSIILPERIVIGSKVRISEFAVIGGGLGTYIGSFVHIANHVSIIGGGTCILEDFVGVCAGARLITGTDDVQGGGIPSPLVPAEFRSFYRSFVVCHRHAFIGTNAIVQPGVVVGEGAVLASGGVATRDLEPWSIYMGAPAKKVSSRRRDTILEMEQRVYDGASVSQSDFGGIDYRHPPV